MSATSDVATISVMGRVLYAGWSILVGASVAVNAAGQVRISDGIPKEDRLYYSILVSGICVLMGVAFLTPASIACKRDWGRPRMGSLLGGVVAIPTFLIIWTAGDLGIELSLLCQLMGLIFTFLALDMINGDISISDYSALFGFGIAVLGAGWSCLDSFQTLAGSLVNIVIKIICAFSTGVGFAMQAKFNAMLAEDTGSPTRAAMLSGVINASFTIPLYMWLASDKQIPVTFHASQLPLWVLAGCQSGFYIASMATLPAKIGFTRTYMFALAGKLVTAAFIDAFGLCGHAIPLDWVRKLSVVLVIFGACLFNVCRNPAAAGAVQRIDTILESWIPMFARRIELFDFGFKPSLNLALLGPVDQESAWYEELP